MNSRADLRTDIVHTQLSRFSHSLYSTFTGGNVISLPDSNW